MAIAPGTVGPGGAKFGAGGGGSARYDYTARGAGLWSIGLDPNDYAGAQAWYNSQPGNVRAEVDKYWSKNKRSGNAAYDMATAVDWRQRDVARKIQKENGFLSSTLGKVLTTALQIGAGFVAGPWAAAGVGAVTGGIQGGIKGALLGGASGYGVGAATQWVANGGLTALTSSLKGGTALTNVNKFMPADIAARASTSASSMAGGTSLVTKLLTASKSPTAQALTAASSVGSTLKKLAAPAAVGTALLATGGLLGQSGSNAVGTSLTPAAATSSPLAASNPKAFEAAREAQRLEAAAAVSERDLIKTTALGLVGKPRTRGKRILGA